MAPGGGQHRQGKQADTQPDPLTGLPGADHHVAAEQAPGHQRDTQAKPEPHVAKKGVVVGLFAGLLLFLLVCAVIEKLGSITGIAHGVNQRAGAGGAGNLGGAVGKIHVGVVHAGGVAQSAFDSAHTGGAGRPADAQLYGLCGAGVCFIRGVVVVCGQAVRIFGAVTRLHQCALKRASGCVAGHGHLLGWQVHDHTFHAANRFQRGGDGAAASLAGGAADGQGLGARLRRHGGSCEAI